MLRRVGILTAVVVMLVFTWLFGMFGIGRITEDVCLSDFDLRSGYGTSTMSMRPWPPSVVCTMHGRDLPDLIVHHYGRGMFYAVWTGAVPPVMLGGVIVLGLALRRYPPLPTEPVTRLQGDRNAS